MCLHFLLHHFFLCSSHTFYTSILFSPPHVTLVTLSQVSYICESAFPSAYCFRALWFNQHKVVYEPKNGHFYDISDQPEDISSSFGVQLYLSGTIGAFHVSAVDDKKCISLSG